MSTNILLAPAPVFRAFASTGEPLVGGKLYTYAAGTLTPLATYPNSTGGTPNANPVILDSTGTANVWMSRAAYKFVLMDANDVVQWTVDQINAQPPKIIDVADYGAVGDGSTDDSTAFTAAATAAGAWGTVVAKRPSVSYKLNSNVTGPCFWQLMGGSTTSGTGTLGGLVIAQVSGGGISVGGVFNITSDGKVGLGTAAPVEALDVSGNINFPYIGGNPSGAIKWLAGGTDITSGTLDFGVTVPYTFTFGRGVLGSGIKAPIIADSLSGNTDTPSYTKAGYTISQSGFKMADGIGRYNAFTPGRLQICNYNSVAGGGRIDMWSNYNDTSSKRGWSWRWSDSSSQTGDTLHLYYQQSDFYYEPQVSFYPPLSSQPYGFGAINISGGLAGQASGAGNDQNCQSAGVVNIWDNSQPSNTSALNPSVRIHMAGNTGTAYPMSFGGSGTPYSQYYVCGSISINLAADTCSFNTSSDYRLKENMKPVDNAIGIVNSVPMYSGNFKRAPDQPMNFGLAHEVQAVLPYAVTGVKDEVDKEGRPQYQQMDYSKLVPVLWAAVQELSAQVEALKKGQANGGGV